MAKLTKIIDLLTKIHRSLTPNDHKSVFIPKTRVYPVYDHKSVFYPKIRVLISFVKMTGFTGGLDERVTEMTVLTKHGMTPFITKHGMTPFMTKPGITTAGNNHSRVLHNNSPGRHVPGCRLYADTTKSKHPFGTVLSVFDTRSSVRGVVTVWW